MFKIEQAAYGLKLTFSGPILVEEMRAWHAESRAVLLKVAKGFSVLVDMTKLGVMPQDTKRELIEGQKLYLNRGMARSAVVLKSVLLMKQLKDDAAASGILPNERYFNLEEPGAWVKAENWVARGRE